MSPDRPDDGPEARPAADGVDLARAALARARADARRRTRADTGGRGGTPTSRPTARSGAVRRVAPDEEPRSGPGPDERDPQRLGSAVDRLVRERGWQAEAAAGGLVARWREIVGPDLAEHVVPESFEPGPDGRGGRLLLRASSTAWATQLRMLLPSLRSRLDAELGGGVIRDVRVVGPAAPVRPAGPRRVPGRGPRDTYG